MHPRSWIELGYDRFDASHSSAWRLLEHIDAEWLGFDAIRLAFTPRMVLVPLCGHTRGHPGVAIQDGEAWVFHCADAMPLNVEFDVTPG